MDTRLHLNIREFKDPPSDLRRCEDSRLPVCRYLIRLPLFFRFSEFGVESGYARPFKNITKQTPDHTSGIGDFRVGVLSPRAREISIMLHDPRIFGFAAAVDDPIRLTIFETSGIQRGGVTLFARREAPGAQALITPAAVRVCEVVRTAAGAS